MRYEPVHVKLPGGVALPGVREEESGGCNGNSGPEMQGTNTDR